MRGADLQTFTADVPLAEGSNTVEAIAYPFGQRASVRVGRDTTPPRIIAMSPATPRTLLAADMAFQGLASEPVRIEIYAPANSYQTRTITISDPAGGFFSPKLHTFEVPGVALDPGLNEILMVLTDRAGNLAEVPIALTRSDTALRILDPVAGSSIPALETSLRLEAVEALSLQALYVGGRQLTSFRSRALQPGISQFSGIPLAPGSNDIRVVYQRYGGPQEVLTTTVTSTAPAVATLRGQLTDAVTGAPVGGATLTITRGAEELLLTSGSDGRYQTDVPAGPFTLVVRRSGFIPAYLSDDAAVGEILDMDAALLRWATGILPATLTGSGTAASHLEGLVTTAADGAPLAGAQVRVTSATATLTALSDGDGAFEISAIPVGPFSVAVSKPGFFPASYEIDHTEAVDVRLAPALRISPTDVAVVATVTNALTDAPESGVRATLLGPNMRVLSDAHGRFWFTHVPIGTQSLRLEKPGYRDAIVQFDALPRADGGPTELALGFPVEAGRASSTAVAPGATGVVRDRFTDRGIGGAEVTVGGQTLTTAANGEFTLPTLDVLSEYDVVATAEDHDPQTIRIMVALNASDPLEFGLRSRRLGYVTGFVRDATSGLGIEGVSIRVGRSELLRARTDGAGRYELAAAPAGVHTLEASHPRYLPSVPSSVTVTGAEEAVRDFVLTRRPTTGGVEGTVTEEGSGAPIAGAVVSHAGTSDTTAADGRYTLSGLPSGLVGLSIDAPGYPPTVRTVAVDADIDASTPTTVVAEIALSLDAAEPTSATGEIRSALGGVVEMPGGRLRIEIPPLALAGDARVTLKLSDSPEVASGAPIPLDPGLGAPEVRALGSELQIRLEPLEAGGLVPKLIAPVILSARYSAGEAAAAGIDESALFPFGWDGTQFTLFRSVPYLHAVDEVNRRIVVGLDFSATESGEPLFAGVGGKALPLLAVVNPIPGDLEQSFFLQLGARLEDFLAGTSATVVLVDMRSDDEVRDEIHANALPLLLIHGWDVKNLLFSTSPEDDPLDDDPRFGQVIRDFLAATKKVYRPVFIGYNSRARAAETANALMGELHGAIEEHDSIRGIPSPSDPESGRFEFVDSFGFSKGGLVERSLQCYSSRVRGMVALGSPHHGALQNLVPLAGPLRDFIARISPGTADLLDYREMPTVAESANPFLAKLNRTPCSAYVEALSLVAGTDSIQIPLAGTLLEKWVDAAIEAEVLPESARDDAAAITEALSLGNLTTGSSSDGIVPVWSAKAQDAGGFDVPALSAVAAGGLTQEDSAFNHLRVGKQGDQALSTMMDDLLLPALSDWITVTEVPPEDPNEPTGRLPTTTAEGFVKKTYELEWHVPHGTISDVLPVVYGRDIEGEWHILSGANPESGDPDLGDSALLRLGEVNSRGIPDGGNGERPQIEINTVIPLAEVGRPSTFIVHTLVFLARLPYEDETLPMEPPAGRFGIPLKE